MFINLIKKTFFFVIIFLLLFLGISIMYKKYVINTVYQDELFSFPENNTFIFGDSHSLCAFSDSIISNSLNLSKNSENYFHTYYKIKKIIKENPQIKKIILNYSHSNISTTYEKTICYSEIYMKLLDEDGLNVINEGYKYRYNLKIINKKYQFIYPEIEYSIKSFHKIVYYYFYIKQNYNLPISITNNLKLFVSILNGNYKIYDYPFFEPRHISDDSKVNDATVRSAIWRHFYMYGEEASISNIMIDYLEKIILLARDNDINLYLINTPINRWYRSYIPENFIKYHKLIIDDLILKYPFVQYYDYSDMAFNDEMWGDGDHLNVYGMNQFSKEINKLINNE